MSQYSAQLSSNLIPLWSNNLGLENTSSSMRQSNSHNTAFFPNINQGYMTQTNMQSSPNQGFVAQSNLTSNSGQAFIGQGNLRSNSSQGFMSQNNLHPNLNQGYVSQNNPSSGSSQGFMNQNGFPLNPSHSFAPSQQQFHNQNLFEGQNSLVQPLEPLNQGNFIL